ncbi:protein SPIRAL1-like 1 [Henckelia pumila]|uniref:protein SPIRAL1-like 1 n=1 Tax=Henckelia pumila TaxID=405737 RepID=UPI003C6E4C52
MGRGVSSGGGQSSLGYLFGDGGAPAPKPATNTVEAPPPNQAPVSAQAVPEKVPSADKQIPAGIPGRQTNNYLRADGQNTGNFLTDRPSTKVQAAPGGGSSLGYLFGGSSK